MSYTHADSMRGHVAIITGGAQGVGKGIATALLERGASVLLVDVRDEKLAATTEELQAVAALEWGRDNIRVNVVCPFVESDGIRFWKEFAPDDYAKAVKRVPMKRIGDVHADAGALVSFLLSSDATFITGQTIHVDGGIGCFR